MEHLRPLVETFDKINDSTKVMKCIGLALALVGKMCGQFPIEVCQLTEPLFEAMPIKCRVRENLRIRVEGDGCASPAVGWTDVAHVTDRFTFFVPLPVQAS